MTDSPPPPDPNDAFTPAEFQRVFHAVREQVEQVVVGQSPAVRHLLTGIFAGGHVMLTGLPGLGRTLLAKTLSEALGMAFNRLQFTPDLLPTDIIGAEILENDRASGSRRFRFFKGPVFANLVLVDEVNRSPARTQAALLEVMQERQVTASGRTYFLPQPFHLIATENSLDTEGTWPMGEAQLDRFMMSIEQTYPDAAAERRLLLQTTGSWTHQVQQVASPEQVLAMQALARQTPVPPSVKEFALSIVRASRPGEPGGAASLAGVIRLGASPRAAQSLLLAAKVTALARGGFHVSQADVLEVAAPVMLHRLLIDVRAAADGMRRETILAQLIEQARQNVLPPPDRWTWSVLKRPAPVSR
ncbi:AAA family ATPase [Lignipirellula cremea]|uniref:ATPase family associated with various cellular activities (AAA) n=1 Tax=Lignipirellula cremea TaxID=2528010 RepID=A0A518DWD8_9BACT|nr:MoxR family ATPase [Lignipirellula cremea]QDU96143.1 ATPase family associated with various cellular activities (AAA) [Lignipirellula cremea]